MAISKIKLYAIKNIEKEINTILYTMSGSKILSKTDLMDIHLLVSNLVKIAQK